MSTRHPRCWTLDLGVSLELGAWSPVLLLRLIPHPILRRLHGKVRVIFERVGEVMVTRVAIHEEDGRNKPLAVGGQLTRRDGSHAARVVPMIIILKPGGWRFIHEDESD